MRVILAKGDGAAEALRRSLSTSPEARIWLPDQASPFGGADSGALFDGVFAAPSDAETPIGLGVTFEYEADEVVAKAGAQTGIGLLALLTPLPLLTRGEVLRHWDEHIPLANVVHHKATSYRQFRFRRTMSAGAPNYAGLAILHFPDAEALRTGLYRNAEDIEAIRADVAEFAEGADTMFVTEYKRT